MFSPVRNLVSRFLLPLALLCAPAFSSAANYTPVFSFTGGYSAQCFGNSNYEITWAFSGGVFGCYAAVRFFDIDLYVTSSALTSTLSGYVTSGSLSSSLSSYVTSSSLTSTLSSYATTSSLSSYATASDLSALTARVATLESSGSSGMTYTPFENITLADGVTIGVAIALLWALAWGFRMLVRAATKTDSTLD